LAFFSASFAFASSGVCPRWVVLGVCSETFFLASGRAEADFDLPCAGLLPGSPGASSVLELGVVVDFVEASLDCAGVLAAFASVSFAVLDSSELGRADSLGVEGRAAFAGCSWRRLSGPG
jgi:hypothetical protein